MLGLEVGGLGRRLKMLGEEKLIDSTHVPHMSKCTHVYLDGILAGGGWQPGLGLPQPQPQPQLFNFLIREPQRPKHSRPNDPSGVATSWTLARGIGGSLLFMLSELLGTMDEAPKA